MPRSPELPRKTDNIQIRHLRILLLETALEGGGPLFDSQADLMRALQVEESSSRPEASRAAMLSQKLKGERSFPPKEIETLRRVAEKRIQERAPGQREEWTARLAFVINLIDKLKRSPYQPSLGRIETRAPALGTTFVIAPYASEALKTPGGVEMMRAFVVTFGLSGFEVPVDRRVHQVVCFSSEADILALLLVVTREAIYDERKDRTSPIRPEQFERVWQRIEREARGPLRLAVLPEAYCLNAVSVFNCEEVDGLAFVLGYENGNFQKMLMPVESRKAYRQLLSDLVADKVVGASFVLPSVFHAQIMYQLIDPAAAS